MIAPFNYSVFSIKRLLHHDGLWETAQENPIELRIQGGFFNELIHHDTFANITNSSLDCTKGSLFIPLIGNRDGHDFIKDALAKGALGFLCNKNHPVLANLNPDEFNKAILVDDTLQALGQLATFHRSRFNPIVIGVTGSSGKTTVKDLLGSVIQTIGNKYVIVTEKNYNNEIGVPFTIFGITPMTKFVICEMGMNHQGELRRITVMIKPDLAIITGVGPAHIEFLKSTANIARAKAEIFYGMPIGGKIFLPEDILHKEIFIKKANTRKLQLKFYSINDSEIKIISDFGIGYHLEYNDTFFKWKFPGRKLLLNLSGVLTLLKDLKFPLEFIVKGIHHFKPPQDRLNIENHYFTIINDCYNANPDSMKSSLEILSRYASKNKKKIAILGDMKELGSKSKYYHEEVGKFASGEKLDGIVTYGKDAEFILKKFRQQAKIHKPAYACHFKNDEKNIQPMIEKLMEIFPPGAIVLIKGSRSLKMEKIIEAMRGN